MMGHSGRSVGGGQVSKGNQVTRDTVERKSAEVTRKQVSEEEAKYSLRKEISKYSQLKQLHLNLTSILLMN